MDTKRIDQLIVGDIIDLANDPYADPSGSIVTFEFEHVTVDYVAVETADCIAIGIEHVDIFGFPPNHEVPFIGHNPEYDNV